MAWRGVPPIPPYAGVCSEAEATRPGYGVQRTVELLLRYHYVQQRLMALGVARLPGTPEWEVKAALGLHAWYDAEQTDGWRRRVAELREPPLHLERCPDAALGAWLDELEAAPGTPELVDGIYAVARPALAAAFARQLREANPLADHPTRRLLRIALAEQEEAIAWGAAAAAALVSARSEAERGAAAQWRRRLEAGLAAAGGLAAEAPPAGAAVPPAPRRALPDLTPRRDGRFADQRSFGYVCDEVAQDAARPPRERAWALVFKRLREMDVPEWMAGIIAETPEAPWEYHRDMIRQLWDEVRHALFGQATLAAHGLDFTALPSPIASSLIYGRELTALERHALLFSIEQGLMDGRTGKRAELEAAAAAGMPLQAAFQDFDWADEVLHTRLGLQHLVRPHGAARIRALAAEASARALPLHYAYCGQGDAWWPGFLAAALAATQARD